MRLLAATLAASRLAALRTVERLWWRYGIVEADNGLGTVRTPVKAEPMAARLRALKADEVLALKSEVVENRTVFHLTWIGAPSLGPGDLVGREGGPLYEVLGVLSSPSGGQTAGTAHVARRDE